MMVKSIRKFEKALGEIKYKLIEKIKKNKIFFCSLFVAKYIEDGETFTEENIRSIRAGYGLHALVFKGYYRTEGNKKY